MGGACFPAPHVRQRRIDPRTARFLSAYRLALLAAPLDFRRRHGDEMCRLVVDSLADSSTQGGSRAWWRRAVFELADVIASGFALRFATPGRYDPRLPLRSALRSTRRRPAFAALSVFVLSLGLGISMAIGAAIDAVLLRPLPYANASRLVMIWRTFSRPGITRGPMSYPDYLDWRASSRSFSDVAAFGGASLTLEDGEPERVGGLRVSGNLFALLGIRPSLGRVIMPDDDRFGAEPTIVLGDALWRRRFGADSAIIGRVLPFGERRFRVIGVMPETFEFLIAVRDSGFLSNSTRPHRARRQPLSDHRAPRAERDVRCRPAGDGTDRDAHRSRAHPQDNPDAGVRLETRHDAVVSSVRPALRLLGLAAMVVLLMACVNVANLFIVRGVSRRGEFAVRRALGAMDGDIVRERLSESVLLAALGWAGGALVAFALIKTLLAIGLPVPRATEIGLSLRVLGVGLLVALAAMGIGALLPLVRIDGGGLGEALASAGRSTPAPSIHRVYAGLVTLQIALALTIFVAAGLLARSFYNLVTVPRGFDGSRTLTAYVSLPSSRYPKRAGILAFYDRLTPRIASLPGVESASGTWALPFSDDGYASSAIVPADRPAQQHPPPIAVAPVLPGFFRTLGMTFRTGRDFTASDDARGQPVAIVNETLANRFWPGAAAIGKQVRPADPKDESAITVVGVVADIKRRGLDMPTEPEVYRPYAQATYTGDLYLTIRVADDPIAIVPALKHAIAELDPALPVTLIATLDDLVDASIVAPRFRTALVGAFATLAAVLALTGVYGVLGFVVAQRRRDIAIRGALGATRSRVAGEVVRHGLIIVAVGLGAGLAGSAGVGIALRSMVFGIGAYDAWTYIAAVGVLCLVSAAGCWLPARRASRVDPMLVLREDAAL